MKQIQPLKYIITHQRSFIGSIAKKTTFLYLFFLCSTLLAGTILLGTGCAQISAPTGGPRDSIAPQLITATPAIKTTHFTGNKITFLFNEYIEIQDVQNNVWISPLQKTTPSINYKLKTVTVKLKDSLLPNTTYSINFGNAIRDVNEGNVLKNFNYVFSTGSAIDSLNLSGQIIIAETGKTDSTILALLYRNADDSAVQKRKPDYIARADGNGNFTFSNLGAGSFKLYALKDGDGNKYYNSKFELFAFHPTSVIVANTNKPVTLYAFAGQKSNISIPKNISTVKKLTYTTTITSNQQDLLTDLELLFNRPLKKADITKITLTDSSFIPIPNTNIALDSTHKKVVVHTKWSAAFPYTLLINNNAFMDSAGNVLPKSDTLPFTTKSEADYGNVVLRFDSLDFAQHPVLQFLQNDEVKMSYKLDLKEWTKKQFPPGEYELQILLDKNNNGKWDFGDYDKKLQPEMVIPIRQRLSVKPNWDNEIDVRL